MRGRDSKVVGGDPVSLEANTTQGTFVPRLSISFSMHMRGGGFTSRLDEGGLGAGRIGYREASAEG